jgi:hemoglobin-like flavoprotein
MTPEQKNLVQATFKDVVPIAETAAKLFYSKLFELDPSLKALFKGDMEEQGRKLMKIIGTAVNGLDRLEEIVPVVEDLGKRHVSYGVKDKDYNTVGTALLWTLQQGLDTAFTPRVEEAWTVVYTLLADTMKNAAARAA